MEIAAQSAPSSVAVAVRQAAGPVSNGKNGASTEAVASSASGKAKDAALEPRTPRSGGLYLRKLLLNPFNLYMLLAISAFGLITGHLLVLPIALIVELIALAVVPRTRVFRRHVDEGLRELERLAAQKAREVLLLQMSDAHRHELERLEFLVEGIRENTRRHGASVRLVLDERLGLSRLTASYIQLAIAYREKTGSLALIDRQRLLENIETLGVIERTTQSPRMRRLVQRRLSIAHRHVEHWDRTREHLEAIAHQLATISELIQLLHAQSMSRAGSQEITDEIDRFMADFKENEGTLRELAELGADGL